MIMFSSIQGSQRETAVQMDLKEDTKTSKKIQKQCLKPTKSYIMEEKRRYGSGV